MSFLLSFTQQYKFSMFPLTFSQMLLYVLSKLILYPVPHSHPCFFWTHSYLPYEIYFHLSLLFFSLLFLNSTFRNTVKEIFISHHPVYLKQKGSNNYPDSASSLIRLPPPPEPHRERGNEGCSQPLMLPLCLVIFFSYSSMESIPQEKSIHKLLQLDPSHRLHVLL